jgi:amino acid transporter
MINRDRYIETKKYIYIYMYGYVFVKRKGQRERGDVERERERERVKIRKKQKKIKPIILGLPTSLAVFKNKSGTERKPNFLDATCAVYYNALPPYYAILSNIYINIYIYIYIYIYSLFKPSV